MQSLDKLTSQQDVAYIDHLWLVYNKNRELIFDGVNEQITKFGVQRLDIANWMMVIGEELGEVYSDLNKRQFDAAKHEIGQTIACLVRLYHEVEREEQGLADDERQYYGRAV